MSSDLTDLNILCFGLIRDRIMLDFLLSQAFRHLCRLGGGLEHHFAVIQSKEDSDTSFQDEFM